MEINAPHLEAASNMSVFCFTGIPKPCLPLLLLQNELRAKEMKFEEDARLIVALFIILILAVIYKC